MTKPSLRDRAAAFDMLATGAFGASVWTHWERLRRIEDDRSRVDEIVRLTALDALRAVVSRDAEDMADRALMARASVWAD